MVPVANSRITARNPIHSQGTDTAATACAAATVTRTSNTTVRMRVPAPAPWPFGHCRSPCFRQVVEQASQVGAGLGVHGPADALVELGLVQAAVAEVLGQAVGDRLTLGVGNPQVLIGVGAAEQRGETRGSGTGRAADWLCWEGMMSVL